MKLPSEIAKGDEQPVADQGGNNATGNNASGEEGARSQEASASAGSGGGGGPGTNAQNAANQPGNPEVDFSEYLWMENEEEFDSQVLQELEDEEMINYYYELYEASLNENGTWGPNTANLRVTGPPPPFAPGSSGPPEDDAVNSLAQGLGSHLTLNNSGSNSGGNTTRLNPEAAEFVPRATNMSSNN